MGLRDSKFLKSRLALGPSRRGSAVTRSTRPVVELHLLWVLGYPMDPTAGQQPLSQSSQRAAVRKLHGLISKVLLA